MLINESRHTISAPVSLLVAYAPAAWIHFMPVTQVSTLSTKLIV